MLWFAGFLISESEALSVYRISAKTEDINEVKAAFNKGNPCEPCYSTTQCDLLLYYLDYCCL